MALQAHTSCLGQKSIYAEFRRSFNSLQSAVDVLRDSRFPRRTVTRCWSFQDNLMLTLVFLVLVSGSRYSQYYSSVYPLEVPLD